MNAGIGQPCTRSLKGPGRVFSRGFDLYGICGTPPKFFNDIVCWQTIFCLSLMGQGDHWSVWECEDYLKHPEKYQISPKNLLFRVHVEVCNKLLHLPFHPVSHRLDLFCYKVLKGSQKCMFADPLSLHDGLRITWNSNITINQDIL